MLVLSRKENESIMIGIHAPKEVEIHRLEVYEKIQRERATEL